LGDCEVCRAAVDHQRALKTSLRAKLARPKAPSDLRARLVTSLDELDAQQDQRLPLWDGLLHRGALVAAAAAVALFFLHQPGEAPRRELAANENREVVAPATRAATTPTAMDLVQRHVARPVEVA